MSRKDDAISKFEKVQAKRAERRALRQTEEYQLAIQKRKEGIKVPEGIFVCPLDSTANDFLRVCKSGYAGAKGQQLNLMLGMTMQEAMEDETLRTKHFLEDDPRDVVRIVANLLDDPDMAAREEAFRNKVGPYFLRDFKLWAHKVFDVYTTTDTSKVEWDVFDQAVGEILLEYKSIMMEQGVEKLVALTPAESVGRLNTDASTGWPFFTKDWASEVDINGETISPIEWALREGNLAVTSGDYGVLHDGCYILFTRRMYRGMVDSVDLKASERAVQCSPLLERILGIGVQQPLMALQKRHPYSQGLNGVQTMGRPMAEAFAKYDVAFEADYSSFDATISQSFFTKIKDGIIKPLFRDEDHPRIDALFELYKTAQLWTPLGVMESEQGPGLMSGSMLTNVIGMIVGHIAWKYFNLRYRQRHGVELVSTAFGYSDDLGAFFNLPDGVEDPSEVVSAFSEIVSELGLVAHKGKQGVWYGDTKQISFLGHVFFPHRVDSTGGCVPIYPIMRSLSKFIFREFQDNSGSDDVSWINYVNGDLTKREIEYAQLLGRLDVMQHNGSFQNMVLYLRRKCGITVAKCRRFLPNPSKSPALSIIADIEAVDGPIDNEEIVPVASASEISDEERKQLHELLDWILDHGSEDDLVQLRSWKKRHKQEYKKMERKRKGQEAKKTLAERCAELEGADQEQTSPSKLPSSPPKPGSDENGHVQPVTPSERETFHKMIEEGSVKMLLDLRDLLKSCLSCDLPQINLDQIGNQE